jgi:polar amino acid transport system substrate-binding protein
MKKLLALVFILFLTACGQEDTLRVGMDLQYPPFETVDKDNNPEGISVDIANALGEYLGREVEVVNTDFAAIIPALESGEIDIAIASMSITEERETRVDFSNPYVFFKIIGLVNKDYAEANNITADTPMDQIMDNNETRFVGLASQISTSIPQSYGFDVLEATEKASAILSVTQGTSDVFLMSGEVVAQAHAANPDTTMIVWSPVSTSNIGMAVQEGNSELLEQVNEFIATMSDPGGVNEQLGEKWDDIIRESLINFGIEFYLNE